jgi:hypothetical protein
MVMADVAESGGDRSEKFENDAIGSIKSKTPYFVAFGMQRQSETL